MEKLILDFPAQFSQGYKAGKGVGSQYAASSFENIVVCGMGGSALPGEILEMSAAQIGLALPVRTHKNYGLPEYAAKKSLVIVVSYSGNTEEALSSYKEALEREIAVVAITTGGQLAKEAEAKNLPFVLIPGGLPPRVALGQQFSAILAVLENAELINSQKNNLDLLKMSIDPGKYSDKALALADSIKERTPLIYASEKYKNLAYILKIQFNENAKKHAFCNYFPELNHNEMAGFETGGNFSVLILRADDDNPRVKERMELTAKIIKEKKIPVELLDIEGEKMYDKIFNTIVFGNWLSYYTAVKNGVDPIPVEIIENFKKEL